jgi:hypothetical protein
MQLVEQLGHRKHAGTHGKGRASQGQFSEIRPLLKLGIISITGINVWTMIKLIN